MIKYYVQSSGQPFYDLWSEREYLIALDGGLTREIYRNNTRSELRINTGRVRNINNGQYKLASNEILKKFGLLNVEDGFYGDSNYKPFVMPNVLDDDSVFVLERKDGNWESAMISGPDFSEPDALKGSKITDEYDNNVLNGNFKPVEIQ